MPALSPCNKCTGQQHLRFSHSGHDKTRQLLCSALLCASTIHPNNSLTFTKETPARLTARQARFHHSMRLPELAGRETGNPACLLEDNNKVVFVFHRLTDSAVLTVKSVCGLSTFIYSSLIGFCPRSLGTREGRNGRAKQAAMTVSHLGPGTVTSKATMRQM